MAYQHYPLGNLALIQVIKLSGEYTLQEMEHVSQILVEELPPGQEHVHLIIDIRELQKFPTNLHDLQQASRPILSGERVGFILILKQDSSGMYDKLMSFVAEILAKLFSKEARLVSKPHEVIDSLRKLIPSNEIASYEESLQALTDYLHI